MNTKSYAVNLCHFYSVKEGSISISEKKFLTKKKSRLFLQFILVALYHTVSAKEGREHRNW